MGRDGSGQIGTKDTCALLRQRPSLGGSLPESGSIPRWDTGWPCMGNTQKARSTLTQKVGKSDSVLANIQLSEVWKLT